MDTEKPVNECSFSGWRFYETHTAGLAALASLRVRDDPQSQIGGGHSRPRPQVGANERMDLLYSDFNDRLLNK
jgi:hypothetical protein